jgi:hypothetical protein
VSRHRSPTGASAQGGPTLTVPDQIYGNSWEIVADAADPLLAAPDRQGSVKASDTIDVAAHAVVVLRALY